MPPGDSGATIGFEAVEPAPTVPATPEAIADTSLLSARLRAGEGELVPGYEILGELGRGGMGVVYRARQVSLNRMVALKMILAGPHAADAVLVRFKAEAEVIARLQHPNIVQIYEVGEHDGRPFFSLELVEGGSLAARINGTPQPPHDAARLIEVLARAVHVAHEQGIVHRDLKPSNILLQPAAKPAAPGGSFRSFSRLSQPATEYGTPKITDFGLAKNLSSQLGQTHTGSIMGTPSYMSPEQAQGENKEIGPATDVYALGAILYELLTGRPPFRADTPFNTIMQVIKGEPVPPTRLIARLPRDLETICLKCLEKPPAKRYPSALHLADDLQRFLEGLPITARPAGPVERAVKWVRRRPTAAALLATLALSGAALVGLGVWAYAAVTQRAADAEAAHGQARAAVELNRQRLVRLCVANGSRQLDGGDLAGAALWFAEALQLDPGTPETEAMHRRRLGTALAQCPRLEQVWAHEGPVPVAGFSPDGKWAVTAGADGVARVWDVATGAAASFPLEHGGPIAFAPFTTDGKRLLTGGPDGFTHLWDLTANRRTRTFGVGSPLAMAVVHPDGKRAVMAARAGGMRFWDLDAGQSLSPILPNARVSAAAFNADGSLLLAAGADGLVKLWNTTTYGLAVTLKHPTEVTSAAFSPDGARVATGCADGLVQVWSATTGEALLPRPLRHRGAIGAVAFSPDGRLLATCGEDRCGQVWDLEVLQRVAPPLRHGSPVTRIVFTPDGRWVVTASDDNTARVWEVATGDPISPVLPHNATPLSVAFAADGRAVLTGGQEGLARLWGLRVPPKSGSGRPIPLPPAAQTVSSADGKLVVSFGGEPVARVRRAADREAVSPPLRHDGPVTAAAFAPDGSWLVTGGAEGVVQAWEATTGRPRWDSPPRQGARVYVVAVSPDGGRVASASDDNTCLLLDAATGRPAAPPIRHSGGVVHAAFGPRGDTLFTASLDGTSRVWDALTGEPLTPPLPPWDGTPWREDLPTDARPAADLVALAQVLTGSRINEAGGRDQLAAPVLRDQWAKLRAKYPADFTAADGAATAWHQAQAEACEAARQWSAAAWQLGRWAALEPGRADLRRRQARAYAELGAWEQAAAEAGRALALDPGDVEAWHRRGVARGELKRWDDAAADLAQAFALTQEPQRRPALAALLKLEAGDTPGYRATCRALLAEHAAADGPAALWAAWACALAPDAVPDAAAVVTLAERAAKGQPNGRLVVGAALLRAGRAAEAAEQLRSAAGEPAAYLLVLAEQKQGRTEQAKQALARAKESSAGPRTWQQRTEAKLLRAEAEAALP